MKKVFVAVMLCLLVSAVAMAQEEVIIKGTVQEVAPDSSYIVVGGQKVLTDPDFLEESYIEVEDEVEITAQSTPEGPRAIDYDFIIEDLDEEGYGDDDVTD